jgi:hypothetical protein
MANGHTKLSVAGIIALGNELWRDAWRVGQDNAGNIYVSTQSATGVLVYNRDGRLVRTIANAYPEVQWSMCARHVWSKISDGPLLNPRSQLKLVLPWIYQFSQGVLSIVEG